jgi:hypothetical protein
MYVLRDVAVDDAERELPNQSEADDRHTPTLHVPIRAGAVLPLELQYAVILQVADGGVSSTNRERLQLLSTLCSVCQAWKAR